MSSGYAVLPPPSSNSIGQEGTEEARRVQATSALQYYAHLIAQDWTALREGVADDLEQIDRYEVRALTACFDLSLSTEQVFPFWNRLLEAELSLPRSTLLQSRVPPLSQQLLDATSIPRGGAGRDERLGGTQVQQSQSTPVSTPTFASNRRQPSKQFVAQPRSGARRIGEYVFDYKMDSWKLGEAT
ncbi:hypothetical protein JCM3765_000615 [Sporobolomyces pararoseus]